MKSMRSTLHLCLASLLLAGAATACCAQATETISIDAKGPTTPFPHFWEQTFGSGRAILSLREGYRNDLRQAGEPGMVANLMIEAVVQRSGGFMATSLEDLESQLPGFLAVQFGC